ncbi:recombinase [Cereibacter sphaeroides WS8N]|uniref:recombinase family protein n=1 Tax=Cereibacter sphaeroides TaxID=1063 RepID=UPI00020DF36B|nr:recombinase family protein [Cereibacter sphaeroides]EGJ22914.1 recombinase [Cereibacter sphaeroides WS8N]
MTASPRRVIIYARYSTDLQNPKSVADQVAMCRREAEAWGWAVINTRSDEGLSGSREDLPGYRKVLDDLRTGCCDIVMFESLDRLSRDQEHTARFHKMASHHEVELFALDGGFLDALRVGFTSTMAQAFLENLAFKTQRGLRARVASGHSAGGRAYGYRNRLDEQGQAVAGELEIDEAEAAVVRRIFRDYAAGISPQQIASRLNAEFIASPRGRGDGSGHWKQNTINGNRERGTGIPNNELYIGRRIWNRLRYSKDPSTGRKVSRLNKPEAWEVSEAPALRIVDQDLWEAVKERQARQTKLRTETANTDRTDLAANRVLKRRRHLLSGLVRCGICGGPMTVAGGSVTGCKRRYYCANAKEKGTSVCAGFPGILQSEIESFALQGLLDLLMQPAAYAQFKAEFERKLKAEQGHMAEDLRLGDRRIAETEKVKANLLRAVESGTFSEALITRLNEVVAELEEMKAQRAAAEPPPVELPEDLPALWRAHIEDLAGPLSDEGGWAGRRRSCARSWARWSCATPRRRRRTGERRGKLWRCCVNRQKPAAVLRAFVCAFFGCGGRI